MIVATFGAASPHVGKQIAYENGQFRVDGLPLTAQQVFDFDTKGELVWAYDGLQQWLRQLVGVPAQPAVPAEPVAPAETANTPVVREPAPAAPEASEPSPVLTASPPEKKTHRTRNVVVGAVAAFVVLVIVVAVLASQNSHKVAATPVAGNVVTATTPTATPALTKTAYMLELTADRSTLLHDLSAVAAAGARGDNTPTANITFATLGGDVTVMESTYASTSMTPPTSVTALNAHWLRALDLAGKLGSYANQTGAAVLAQCVAALEKTGASASVCSSISADLSRGLWVGTATKPAATPRVTPKPKVESASTAYKASCRMVSFPVLDKEAGSMKGRRLKIHGQVFQIQDAGAGKYWQGYPDGITPRTTMLVSITSEGYGMWTDNVDVAYDGALSHVFDKDIVTVWGTCVGQYSYTSVAGYQMTVPLIHAKFVTKQ